MNFNSEMHRKKLDESKTFKAKNYKNSPLVREFFRFVAKNNLRNEAFKVLEKVSRVRQVVYNDDYLNDLER
jgi:hypothetical protein